MVTWKRAGVFMATLALLVQPIVTLNLPAAFAATATATVTNNAELVAAAADTNVTGISIKASFAVSQKIVFSGRNVWIDGNANKLTFTADAAGWQGNYVFQAYKNTLQIKNLAIMGGDAAVYANGATLDLQGTVDVSGNEFGGIEVSQGSGVTTPAVLRATGTTVVNSTEAAGLPTVWIDQSDTANATVNGPFTLATHIKPNQKQYYLVAANAGVVATNTSTGRTFASLQNAIDDAQTVTGNTIVLNEDIVLGDQSVRVTKSLTIDGNGKTVSTTFNKGVNGVSNAALIVLAPNTTVKNMTVTGNGTAAAAHGIVVQGVTGVMLTNVMTTNNAAGVIVNGSTVTIDGIHTSGNSWYGVDVDKAGATLTIKGVNTHTEAAALYVDNTAIGHVVDTNDQYGFANNVRQSGDRVYNLKLAAPTLVSPSNGALVNGASVTNSWSIVPGAVKYEYQSFNSNNVNTPIRFDGDFATTSKTATNVANGTVFYWRVRAIDAAGVRGEWSTLWKVAIDSTPPAAPTNLAWVGSDGSSATNGITNIQNGTLSWKQATPSDVDHYVYKFWTNIPGYQDDAAHPWTDSYTYVVKTNDGGHIPTGFADKEGTYYFCVSAVDAAGNESSCSATKTITYDATAPIAAITTPGAGSIVHGIVTVTGTVDDQNPMNSYLSISGPNGYNTASFYGDGRLTHLYDWNTSGLADGVYTIKFETRDKAQNKDATSVKTVTVTVDNTAPVVVYTNTVHDTAAGTDTIKGTTDDSAPVIVTVDGTSYTVHPVNGIWSLELTGLTVGTHNVSASSTDAQGNQSAPRVFTVTVGPVDTSGTHIDSLAPLSARLDTSRQRTSSLIAGTNDTTDTSATPTLNSAAPQGKVLGTQDTKTNLEQTAAIAPGAQGWTFWGIAWYWFVLIAAAAAGIAWFVIGAKRRARQEN